MISVTPNTDTESMDEHPWTGLTREDLEEAYPLASECTGLGHVFPAAFGYRLRECVCGTFYVGQDGKRRAMPDPSQYLDPPDPRDWT